MRRRRIIAIVVLLLVVVGVVAIWVIWPSEPEYQGRTLRAWLADIEPTTHPYASPERKQAAEAIRQMGPQALHILTSTIPAQDTSLKKMLLKWAPKQHLLKLHLQSADEARQYAMFGYEAFGPAAASEIPALIHALTNSPSPNVRREAAAALGLIGPPAKTAAPALFEGASDTNNDVRNNCLFALGHILPDPVLTVPVLITGLDDSYVTARENAAFGLAKYGPQATSAVPTLLRTMSTNRAAPYALKQIDPEAAAKAGVK